MLLLREILDPKYGMFKEYEETRTMWFSEDSFEEEVMYFLIGSSNCARIEICKLKPHACRHYLRFGDLQLHNHQYAVPVGAVQEAAERTDNTNRHERLVAECCQFLAVVAGLRGLGFARRFRPVLRNN